MLFVIQGIKCGGAQRRVVVFYLQSPNEEESISLTSANIPRHSDKHWIFIIHYFALHHSLIYTRTHIDTHTMSLLLSPENTNTHVLLVISSFMFTEVSSRADSSAVLGTNMKPCVVFGSHSRETQYWGRWCKWTEIFKEYRWTSVLFSADKTFRPNKLTLEWNLFEAPLQIYHTAGH